MALGTMNFERKTVGMNPEILYNSEYVGKAVTLDTTAFTNHVCKAGTPISADGKSVNDDTAIGILLMDVYDTRPQATVVIGGYIKTAVAQTHSGVTVAADAMSAMKNVVFC